MLTTNLSIVTNTVQSTLQQSANESRPFKSWNKTPVGQISFSIPARKATVFLNLPKNLKTGQTQVYISNPFFHTVKAGKLQTLAHQHWKITFGWAPSARSLMSSKTKDLQLKALGAAAHGGLMKSHVKGTADVTCSAWQKCSLACLAFSWRVNFFCSSDTAGTWQMSISTQT